MPRKTKLAVIGGTSLLQADWLAKAKKINIRTSSGSVTLLQNDQIVFLQRHGQKAYTPPHLINHKAHLAALFKLGVEKILAVGSVGSLHPGMPPGTLFIPDDFYAPQVNNSFYNDVRGHIAPGFPAQWRAQILAAWEKTSLPLPVHGGVYWQTTGPRFETPAEIRMHQNFCHTVGMTIASECILAAELNIPYAALCMVDNLANGVEGSTISYETFKQQVQSNRQTLLKILDALLKELLKIVYVSEK
ncbi:MAG: MTAP family purine nucleoside phosphorylase [Magnetococcus sp. DMHC-6]